MNATQLEFQSRAGGKSQCDKILEHLRAAGEGVRVAMPELVRISGSYNIHSRVSELNHKRGERDGFKIHNESKRGVSVYWIEYFEAP